MNPTEREKIERLMRSDRQERPPDDLLVRLREDLPDQAKIPDPDKRERESYFGRPSVWLTAASLAMLFTFTFMLSRITFLDQSTEPDIVTILEQQRRATKISQSAADETPVGAAARRRPADELEPQASTPEATLESAPATAVVADPQPQSPPARVSVVEEKTREERSESAAIGESRESSAVAAAPPPPAAAGAPLARSVSRPAVVRKARLAEEISLPAELRVVFTVDASGRVVEVSVQSQPGLPRREEVESILGQWTFEPGRPGSFELLVQSSDLQPLPG